MVGEVVGARGASLGGPYGAAVKAHACVAVDESRSSLAARCVSFYHIVCLPVCLKLETAPLRVVRGLGHAFLYLSTWFSLVSSWREGIIAFLYPALSTLIPSRCLSVSTKLSVCPVCPR